MKILNTMDTKVEPQETVFYQDNNVVVTKTRYVANGVTYVLKNISSVTLYEVSRGYIGEFIIGFVGVLTMLGGGFYLILGFILIILGVLLGYKKYNNPEYTVKITSNAGEVNTFTSGDRVQVQKIVDALSEAIIRG